MYLPFKYQDGGSDQLDNHYYSRANRNVWSAALSQAKNEGDRLVGWSVGLRRCIRPWLEHRAPGLDGMRWALVLFRNAV